LIERGLVEDCSEAHQSESGKFFLHITALGVACMNVGYILRDPRPMSGAEMKQITAAKEERDGTTTHQPTTEANPAAGTAEAGQGQPGRETAGTRERTSA
jgi:hypothetical protein